MFRSCELSADKLLAERTAGENRRVSIDHHQEQRLAYMRAQQRENENVHSSTRRSYEQLRSSIRSGALRKGPLSEPAIKSLFGASRNSVRRSLQMLAVDGLLSRRPRVGTGIKAEIVNLPSSASDRSPTSRLIPSLAGGGESLESPDVEMRYLSRRVVRMPAGIAERLNLTADRIIAQEHVGYYAGEAILLHLLYVPLGHESFDSRPGGAHPGTARMQSLEKSFADEFGESMGSSGASIEAVPADRSTARLLGVDEGSPLLMREMRLTDVMGVPRSYCFTYFRGDRVALGSSNGPASS